MAPLAEAGFTDIINLQSGVYEKFHDDKYEHEKASDFGMAEHNLKLSDITPPTLKQLREVIKIIRAAKGKVLIHCLRGADRTGFVCFVLDVQMFDVPKKVAMRKLFAHGFNKKVYFWWLPFLNKYTKGVLPELWEGTSSSELLPEF